MGLPTRCTMPFMSILKKIESAGQNIVLKKSGPVCLPETAMFQQDCIELSQLVPDFD